MRVELLYAPNCSTYKRTRNTLETIIAEEGLPVPVEMVEETDQVDGAPTLRINGNVVHSVSHHIDHVREAICKHWKDLTEKPMARPV